MTTEMISVIGLIIVAIITGLSSGLVPAYLQHRRETLERVAAERDRIHSSAKLLLRNLANFRHSGQEDQSKAAGLASHQQVTAEMRGSYDAWGLVVMPWLTDAQQEEVRSMRKGLGRENLNNTEAQDMSMSSRIFELTWAASKNVR